jgi:tetratricopeptide (TPR) repeat protein
MDAEGDTPTAEDARVRASKNPRSGYRAWAYYYMTQGRFSDALAVIRESGANDRNDPRIMVAMGKCYEGLGDGVAAERMYLAATEADPEQGHLALGQYYARQGNDDKAEQLLREALKYNARKGYIELGSFYRERKKYAQAEESFKYAVAYDSCAASINLINLYAESGRYEEAEAEYDKALVQYPREFLTNFAILYYVPRGKYADAIRCFLKALDQPAPPDMSSFFLMTSVFKSQSQYGAKDVLTVMDRAVARNPFLEKIPTFRAYREYFQDIDGWEQKQNRWLENDLENIAALCHRKGIALIILNYPQYFPSENEALASLAARHGLQLVDLNTRFSQLVAQDGKGKYFQKDDMHCTQEGNRIMADSIFQAMRAKKGS